VTATRAIALALAGAAFLAAQASGHGVISREGNVLRYEVTNNAGVGASLKVSTPETGILEFEDTTSNGGVFWGPCTPVTEKKTRCESRGVSRLEIRSDENDDSLRAEIAIPVDVLGGFGDDRIVGGYRADALEGGLGADRITAGLGRDSASGGEGDDVIDVRDGVADSVSCGGGFDTVRADSSDQPGLVPLLDCESVDVGPPPPDQGPPNTPPDTRITKSPDRKTKRESARFAFRATESRATFECSRDNSPYRPCSSPKRYRNLARGGHVFKVRATDREGNTDPTTAAFHWKVKK